MKIKSETIENIAFAVLIVSWILAVIIGRNVNKANESVTEAVFLKIAMGGALCYIILVFFAKKSSIGQETKRKRTLKYWLYTIIIVSLGAAFIILFIPSNYSLLYEVYLMSTTLAAVLILALLSIPIATRIINNSITFFKELFSHKKTEVS